MLLRESIILRKIFGQSKWTHLEMQPKAGADIKISCLIPNPTIFYPIKSFSGVPY